MPDRSSSGGGAPAVCEGRPGARLRRCCGAAECSRESTALGLSRQLRAAGNRARRNRCGRITADEVCSARARSRGHDSVNWSRISPSDSTRGATIYRAHCHGHSFRGWFPGGCSWPEAVSAHFALRRLCQCVCRHRILRGHRGRARGLRSARDGREPRPILPAADTQAARTRSACTRLWNDLYEALEAAVLDVLHRHLALTECRKPSSASG